MYSLIHTPITENEAIYILRISAGGHRKSMESGALQKSYRDPNDHLSRVQHHNISDLVYFQILLSLGWPRESQSIYSEEADYAFDVFAESWETLTDELFGLDYQNKEEDRLAFMNTLARRLRCSIDLAICLDDIGKRSFINRLCEICDRVDRVIYSRWSLSDVEKTNRRPLQNGNAIKLSSKGKGGQRKETWPAPPLKLV